MDLTRLYSRSQRVAVTGIAGGGKTVFLTSLIGHLMEHEPDRFRVGSNAFVRLQKLPASNGTAGEEFRYDYYRDALSGLKQWPEKTADSSHWRCRLRRTDRRRPVDLHLYDFPGERIADTAIATHRDFAAWSDHMLAYFRERSAYREAAGSYLELQDDPDLTPERLLRAYKELMAEYYITYKPLITPSTFLLDRAGDYAGRTGGSRDEIAAGMVEERLSGLPPAEPGGEPREFAPMSAAVRERMPEAAEKMAAHYRAYRREVVKPLFAELLSCRSLVVLVDVASLLMGGVERYNDNRQIVKDLFERVGPEAQTLRSVLSLVRLSHPPLRRIAVVASQADRCHPQDMERLEGLVQEMTRSASHALPNVEFGWFAASACVSTDVAEDGERLIGRPYGDNPEKREAAYPVSRVPDHWPGAWEPGDFRIPLVYPEADPNTQIPLPHRELDRVFEFLTE